VLENNYEKENILQASRRRSVTKEEHNKKNYNMN